MCVISPLLYFSLFHGAHLPSLPFPGHKKPPQVWSCSGSFYVLCFLLSTSTFQSFMACCSFGAHLDRMAQRVGSMQLTIYLPRCFTVTGFLPHTHTGSRFFFCSLSCPYGSFLSVCGCGTDRGARKCGGSSLRGYDLRSTSKLISCTPFHTNPGRVCWMYQNRDLHGE